jgi:hypothetical protein
MERLTAFEFVPAQDGIHIVILKNKGVTIAQIGCVIWVGLQGINFEFEKASDLSVEGPGYAKAYWNDDTPAWRDSNPVREIERIGIIRDAARRMLAPVVTLQ